MYKTNRAQLRRPAPEDLSLIQQLEADPDVVRWTPMRTPRTPEQSRQRLENQIKANAGHPLYGYWLAETRDGGEFIGWFMVVEFEPDSPSIGFMLVKPMWRKGFAREISTRLIKAVFTETRSRQILATVDDPNDASHRALLALGFEATGTTTQTDNVLAKEFQVRNYRLLRGVD